MSEKSAAQLQTLRSDLSAATAEREELRPEPADRLAAESSVHAEMKEQIAERESREDELRTLRAKLGAEVQARRLAQEKIAQLQEEMAGYRRTAKNPAVLRETEKQLAKRVGELAVAQDQVRTLTEELRTARAANVQQNERVDKLRRSISQLKEKCDVLAESVKKGAQGQSQLLIKLNEETAKRQAAEADIERLRQRPPPARPDGTEPEEMDAETLADLRSEIQAAIRAAAPNRPGATAPARPGGIQKAGPKDAPSREKPAS
jgi:DNA repair exonuclease SbcCD ATPase subunit